MLVRVVLVELSVSITSSTSSSSWENLLIKLGWDECWSMSSSEEKFTSSSFSPLAAAVVIIVVGELD